MTRSVVLMLEAKGFELIPMFVLQGRILPFTLRFEKQGESITANDSQRDSLKNHQTKSPYMKAICD